MLALPEGPLSGPSSTPEAQQTETFAKIRNEGAVCEQFACSPSGSLWHARALEETTVKESTGTATPWHFIKFFFLLEFAFSRDPGLLLVT